MTFQYILQIRNKQIVCPHFPCLRLPQLGVKNKVPPPKKNNKVPKQQQENVSGSNTDMSKGHAHSLFKLILHIQSHMSFTSQSSLALAIFLVVVPVKAPHVYQGSAIHETLCKDTPVLVRLIGHLNQDLLTHDVSGFFPRSHETFQLPAQPTQLSPSLLTP